MNIVIRVCCSVFEIKRRISLLSNTFNFRIEGRGLDNSIILNSDLPETIVEDIYETFEDVFYGEEEMNLAQSLVHELREKGLYFACAESLTGGMISSAIVDVPGCSEVFHEGLVTYSNISKMDRLGVGEDTVIDYGAVSREVAIEMANGLINDNVSIAVATTGIAGPTGGSEKKPVGLTFISVVSEKITECYQYVFLGDRNEIRKAATDMAIFKTLKYIKNNF